MLALPAVLGSSAGDIDDHVGSKESEKGTFLLYFQMQNSQIHPLFHQIQSRQPHVSLQSSTYSVCYSHLNFTDAYLPLALRVTHPILDPDTSIFSSHDFWQVPKISEETLQDHVHNLLESAAAYFRLDKFTDILSTMNHIVSATATFRDDINGVLDAHNITFDILCQGLEDAFMVIIDGLEKIPPPDKAPGHAERLEMFDKIMNDTTKGITNFATPYGLEDEFSPFFSGLKPHVQSLIVTIGMLTPFSSSSGGRIIT